MNSEALQSNHVRRVILDNRDLDPLRGFGLLQKQKSQAGIPLLDTEISLRVPEDDRCVDGFLLGDRHGGREQKEKGTQREFHFKANVKHIRR